MRDMKQGVSNGESSSLNRLQSRVLRIGQVLILMKKILGQ